MNRIWRKKTGSIIGSLIASLVTPIVWAIGFIILLMMFRNAIYNIPYEGTSDAQSIKEFMWVWMILGGVAVLGIFIWYCVALGGFASIQKNWEDRLAARKVLGGYLVLSLGSIAAAILNIVIIYMFQASSLTPFLILAVSIAVPCIAYSMMITGYSNLSESNTFNERCKSGFECLRQSTVISLVGVIISFLSQIIEPMFRHNPKGYLMTLTIVCIAMLVLAIISIVKIFQGWSRVKNNGPYIEEDLEQM